MVSRLAEADGEIIGAGKADVTEVVGGLFGLSVLPAWRRRGVQQALIVARLEALRERGCRWATISSEPGVATERNARRMGFELAYTKVDLRQLGGGPDETSRAGAP